MTLGLPDTVRACLFDLDGVLTETASIHAAAWKEMFDEFLRGEADRRGQPFVPFDEHDDYDRYVDGKPRLDGVRDFLASRDIHLPEGEPDDPPTADTVEGLGSRKNAIVVRRIREQGVEAYPGSVAYVRAARDAGLGRAVVSSSSNCRGGAEGRRHPGSLPAGGRRGGGRTRAPARASRRPTPIWPGPVCSGCAPARRPCSRMPWRVSKRAGPVTSAGSSGSTGSGRPRPSRPTAPAGGRRSGRVAAGEGRIVIPHPTFRCEPGGSSRSTCTTTSWPRRNRCSPCPTVTSGCGATWTRASRTACPGRYLGSFYELRPLSSAELEYAEPNASQTVVNVTNGKIIRLLVDDEPFDVRYGDLRQHERVLDLRAGTLTRTAEWESPGHRAIQVRSTRLVSFTQRAMAAISTRSMRWMTCSW